MTDKRFYKNIDDVVRRYFEGETNEQEEALLRCFLATKEGSDKRYDEVRAVMAFTTMGRQEAKKKTHTITFRPRWAIGVAASLLLVFGISLTVYITTANKAEYYAYVDGQYVTDPEAVRAEMERSMSAIDLTTENEIVSSTMNDIFAPINE